MSNRDIMVVAKDGKGNNYYIVRIDGNESYLQDISNIHLRVLVKEQRVINYDYNREYAKIEYNQGSESRLDITSNSGDRIFIIDRLVKNNKTLGFNVLFVKLFESIIYSTKLWRLNYSDTLKLMHKYECINAKKSDTESKISALKGNFREIEIKDSKYKPNKSLINTTIGYVDNISKGDNITDGKISGRQRLKEYNKLYSDYMIAPNGEILEQYTEKPTMQIIKNQLENGRYKQNIKRTLAIGLAIAAIGGIGGNAIGAINFMPENRIEINKSIESPKTKAEAVAVLSMADSITVDYGIDFTHGVVYADGVKVATLNTKLFAILNDSTLKSLDGETIASTDQKFSLFGNFKVVNENNDELTVNGHFKLFQTKLTQKDSNGNTLTTIANRPETFGTKAYIKDESDNVVYEITKELFGKTFTLKKVDNSTELSNSEALMLASILQLQAEKSSGRSSNSSKSK